MSTNIYTKRMLIGPSICDFSSRLSIPDTLRVFMDTATEDAEEMGIGPVRLAKDNLFWLTEKTKVKFYRRPYLCETVEVSTWTEQPDGTRCIKDYTIKKDGELLVEGKTLWTVMDMSTGKLKKIQDVYPENIEIPDEITLPEGFVKFDDENFGGEFLGEYTVQSTDIDLGRHMNNCAYAESLESLFSTAEWKKADFSELEIHFKGQCREGEKLTFMKKEEDGVMKVLAYLANEKVVCRFILR